MYKYKEVKKNVKDIFLSMCDAKIFDIYVTEYGTALTTILPILFLYLNTVIVTAGTFGTQMPSRSSKSRSSRLLTFILSFTYKI
jgi:hypothetical protein